MAPLQPYLDELLYGSGYQLRFQAYPGSSLVASHPGALDLSGERIDWQAHVRELTDEFHPSVVVIEFCCNYWPPYPTDAAGEPIAPESSAWDAHYENVVRATIAWLSAHGVERIGWVVTPPNRNGDAIIASINAITNRALLDCGQCFAITWDTITDAGRYTEAVGGRAVRHEDGLHLSAEGARLAAIDTVTSLHANDLKPRIAAQ